MLDHAGSKRAVTIGYEEVSEEREIVSALSQHPGRSLRVLRCPT
jgi:hypothetical protein